MAEWTKEVIREKLQTDDKWLCRGLVAIYEKQTADEQNSHRTRHHNKVGFNRIDARFLTSLAESFRRFNRLTGPQLKACRKQMVKYAGQLALIANGEI